MRSQLFLVLAVGTLCGPAGVTAQQTRTISGTVVDALTGQPLDAVAIGTSSIAASAYSRADGRFTIEVATGPVELVATRLGYKRATAQVPAGENTVAIRMETDVLGLEEIVVTGQATGVARRNIANSVGTVSADELNRAPASSVEQMLSGKMAGVSIAQNSGAPGGGSRVRLRGITSITGPGAPLYVVDGIIVSDARNDGGMNAVSLAQGRNNISSTEQMNPTNRIADLNPDIIERIEVLKGASASAIYGSKASNGVILITTKRGRPGEARYNVRQSFGVASRAFTYGSRYFNTLEDAVDAFGPQAADYWTPGYTPVSLEDQLSGRDPLQRETAVTVSGGSETTRFFIAGLLRSEPGIVIDTYADKASLRLNLDQSIGSKISLTTGLEVLRTESDRGMFGNDNAGTSYYFVVPHQPNFFDLRPTCPNGTKQVECEGGVYPENPFVASNPLQSAAEMTREERVWRFLGSIRADYEALRTDQQELRFSLVGGFDQFTQRYNLVSPPELFFEDDDGLPGTRVLSFADNLNANINANGVHRYTTENGGLAATTSLGLQFEYEDAVLERSATRGLVGGTANLGAGTSALVEESKYRVKDLGIFAQEELLLGDRLLLTVGGRADRSSNNGDPHKYYFYPKGAASYRFGVGGPLDEVKVRAAYGQSGNRPIFGQKYSRLATTNIASVGGLRVAPAAGAEDVRPERQTEVEGGVDLTLLGGRALIELTGYRKTIKDLLFQRELASSTGFTSEIFNGGRLRVWGFETVVNMTPVRTPDWQWDAVLNWSRTRNKVVELPVPSFTAAGGFSQGAIVIEEGKPATQWVGNDTLPGAFDSNNPQLVVRQQGDAEPRWTGGLSNTVTWRRLSFGATLDAVKGGIINLGTWRHFDLAKNAYDHDEIDPETGVKKGDQRRRWMRSVPRTYSRDASYIKLREARLTWNVPTELSHRLWGQIDGLTLSLAGRNLFTNQSILGGNFYQGTDPETANYNSGAQYANNVLFTREFAGYPSSRSFWLTVDVSF